MSNNKSNNKAWLRWCYAFDLPALVSVLYTGQTYIPDSGCFLLAIGISNITGISVYSFFGSDSPSSNFSESHLAPSRNNPLM